MPGLIGFGFFFDPLFLALTIPTLIFSLWAQAKVKSTFKRFSKVGVRSGMTGAEAAEAVMRAGGVHGVSVEKHQGFLSDHYDPRAKSLRLSPEVYDGRSVSSIAVAAHEAGHSIQDVNGYAPLVVRSQLVPLSNLGASLWFLPFIGGMLFNMSGLLWLAVGLFATVVFFQLVTLPTEFDASRRAKAVLAQSGIVSTADEARGVEKVLNAAAMTYVAAAAASIMQLVYLVMRARD